MSVVDVEQGSAAWLTERRKGITASDSGVVCGVSPYSTARALWQLKSGRVRRVEDEPESEATAYGHRYESAIAQHYEFLTKNRVHQVSRAPTLRFVDL
jgi:predicted phage-related endonuclease